MTLLEIIDYLEHDSAQIKSILGLKKEIKVEYDKIDVALDWYHKSLNHHLISIDDEFYPPLLKQITDPPIILFVKGNKEILLQPSLAIVGSRMASYSGLQITRMLTEQLCQSQIMICSGMALGIDAEAHRTALKNNANTLAVLGAGMNHIYPKSHVKLADEISKNSCLISEFWPNVQPYPSNFPKRNRIISGIAMGTLVVEAKKKSGSLITARLAMEQGREVFAVPGSILTADSKGCHDLIRNGAKLIESAVDILEELTAICSGHLEKLPKCSELNEAELSELPFSSLLASVSYEVTTLDEVVEHSGKTIDLVLEQLLELELQGWVASVPGGYIRLKRG